VGKSNLLESIGYLSTLKSFRGVPGNALVMRGGSVAVVRAEVVDPDNRPALVETEITTTGRSRTQVNRVRTRRARDLLETLVVSVFTPDDLKLVKEGPTLRRDFCDEVVVGTRPSHDSIRSEWERALKQRNAFLKQLGSFQRLPLGEPEATTLSVWDEKASVAGEALVDLRVGVVARMGPAVTRAYRDLSGADDEVDIRYLRSWDGSLAGSLADSVESDIRRGVTRVGPHRDDLELLLNGLPARTHASQGEQRCLSLALRLAAHRELTSARGSAPVLLLDDVFSELDPDRSAALLDALPEGQAFLSTAGPLPEGCVPECELVVTPGSVARR
jgi:DNA replication and repair protein RecF